MRSQFSVIGRFASVTGLVFVLASPSVALAGFKCSKGSGDEVVEHLADPDFKVRLDCLGEIEDRRLSQAEDALVGVSMNDGHPDVRVTSMVVLEKLGSSRVIEVAHHLAVADPDDGNRGKALRIIEKFGSDASAAVLAQVVAQDAIPGIRRKAVVIIGKRKWAAAEPTLLEYGLRDVDQDVMLESARTIVALGNPTARPYVHPIMLEHPDERVREKVIRAIEDFPLPSDRDALIAALDDSNPHAARHAARALVKIGDKSVAPLLREKAMQVKDTKVAEEFSEAAFNLER